jgi:hypothetical protein
MVAVAVLMVWPTDLARRARATCLLAFLVGFLPLVGLWMARNARLTGHWFISTIATHNLLLYRAGGVEAACTGQSLDEVQRRYHKLYGDVQFFDDRTQFDRKLMDYRQTSYKILRDAPSVAAKQAALAWAWLLFGPGAKNLPQLMYSQAAPARWWPPIYTVVLICAVIAGIFGGARLGKPAVLLVALVVYFVVLAGGPEANSRFRTPVTPMLAVLAVAGLWGRATA